MEINTKHKNKFNMMSIMPTLNARMERQTILSILKPTSTVVGSYAFNKQVVYPVYQKRPFSDIDIKSRTPRKTAIRIERSLDKMALMDNYHVSVLEHDTGKTFRVHSKARGNEVVADVGSYQKHIPSRRINNVSYETLKHRKKAIQAMLKDPEASYRRAKDERMLGYINRYQNQIDSDLDGEINAADADYKKRKKW